MNTNLNGKIVLVTGGAGNIGAVISKSFAKQGAKVIIHYNKSKENAEKIATEIKKTWKKSNKLNRYD